MNDKHSKSIWLLRFGQGAKTALIVGAAILAGCNQSPITDAQVESVSKNCFALGMAVRIFNGLTSYAECAPIGKK